MGSLRTMKSKVKWPDWYVEMVDAGIIKPEAEKEPYPDYQEAAGDVEDNSPVSMNGIRRNRNLTYTKSVHGDT
jgi:hypothetical protein